MKINKNKISMKNRAIDLCMANNESLTPNRLVILDIMQEKNLAISAYEINSILKKRRKNLNISSIYRVIEF